MAMCIIIITATNAFELARYHCVKLIDIASVKRWQPVFDPKRTHWVPLTESAFVSRNNIDRIFRCVRRLFVVIGVFRTLPGFRFIFPVYIFASALAANKHRSFHGYLPHPVWWPSRLRRNRRRRERRKYWPVNLHLYIPQLALL